MRLFSPVPTISLAQRTDAAGLAELYARVWEPCRGRVDERMIADQCSSEEEVSSWLRGGFEVYRATLDGSLVGAVRCSFPTGACLVDRLVVAPEARGHGFGKFLGEHAIGRAKRAGVTKVWLNASPRLETVVNLFDALGFRECGTVSAPDWGERKLLMEMNV
jgi:GNAT superfamily N-acetyltransferase